MFRASTRCEASKLHKSKGGSKRARGACPQISDGEDNVPRAQSPPTGPFQSVVVWPASEPAPLSAVAAPVTDPVLAAPIAFTAPAPLWQADPDNIHIDLVDTEDYNAEGGDLAQVLEAAPETILPPGIVRNRRPLIIMGYTQGPESFIDSDSEEDADEYTPPSDPFVGDESSDSGSEDNVVSGPRPSLSRDMLDLRVEVGLPAHW